MVLLASALVQEPRLLLLDEPTTHLDFGNQARFLEIVNGLARQGIAIVMSTHFPDHALLAASTVAVIRAGKLMGFGEPAKVLTEELIQETYDVDVRVIHLEDAGIRTCVPVLSGNRGKMKERCGEVFPLELSSSE